MRPIIRLFFKTLRLVLTPFLLLADWLTTPRGVERPAALQQRIDHATATMVLYQFRACPFCIKVRRAIKRLTLRIELRDAKGNPVHRAELLAGGGEIKVPCLRLTDDTGEVTWLYESAAIIEHLQQLAERETMTGQPDATEPPSTTD